MRVRTRRRLSAAACAAPVLLFAAAWIVPPRLDLDGYRDTFAALAARTLGRPVTIGGAVHLSLLPEAVLTADRVDVGDGAFTTAGLRLRVAVWPLLAGRVVPRELVLRGPALHLSWPPPHPRLALVGGGQPLAARIEDGTLTLGGAGPMGQAGFALTGIAGTVAVGDTGALSATGSARAAGRDWRFGLKLTSAGTDGAAGLDLAVDSPGMGAAFSGQIAGGGTVAGDASLRTDDLSAAMPAPRLAARAAGRVVLADGVATADDLRVDVGGIPGRAAASLRLAPDARLDASLTLGRLDLDSWAEALGTAPPRAALPVGLDISAEAATLRGGTLRHLRLAFEAGPDGVTVHEADAALPGEALVHLAGHADPAGGRFEGTGALRGEAMGRTLAWLAAAGIAPFGAAPPAPPRALAVTASVRFADGTLALSGIDGTADGAPVAGEVAWRPGALAARLRLDSLDLDALTPSVRGAAHDLDLDLTLGRATWGGVVFSDVSLSALAVPHGVVLRRFAGRLAGAEVAASGALSAAGVLADGRLDVTAADASALAALLPPSLQATPALWRGRLALAARAAGPPEALAGHATLALGDLQAEASPVLNLATFTLAGPVALRHPGAPRLLTALGLLPQSAPAWLGDGSLALTGQVSRTRDRTALDTFTLAAGALRATGSLAWDTAGPLPRLTGRLDADTLTLPLPLARTQDPLPLDRLHGWEASVDITAASVLLGLSPSVEHLTARIGLADGVLGLGRLSAQLAGGTLQGAATVETEADPPTITIDATLDGAHLAGPLADLPLDLLAGTASARVHATASGYSAAGLAATLAGHAALDVADGTLAGLDLPALGTALAAAAAAHATAPGGLADAMQGGGTGFARLHLAASLAHGTVTVDAARLESEAGTATCTGTVGLATRDADLTLAVQPALPDTQAPTLGLRLTGPLAAPRRTPELAAALRWLAGS